MTGTAEDLRRVKPDPAHPQAANGNFEDQVGDNGFIPGWYYERQAEWTTDARAPEGQHYVTFKNEVAGRSSHLLQGLPIDGRQIAEIELSAMVKYAKVIANLSEDAPPSVGITFYDENRNDLGHNWIGPFRGSAEWTQVKKRFRVPIQAREGLLRIGLFGATGELSFDAVTLKPIAR
jgi:protein-L-isoaspartate(D-aspartate) O-methyltransferase